MTTRLPIARAATAAVTFALLALAAPQPATAAPPPNDNRADSQLLPTFPATVQGTTAEATLERLDPQVSPCGRIEATVWYRLDAAPDGQVVTTLQAGAGLAAIVRIYRRDRSSIRELDCGTTAPGGSAVTSFATVRGAGYFILVGRRPGTADGEFGLQAELHLPPANDRYRDAERLGHLPKTIQGTTLGAGSDESDGGACGLAGGSVWYRLSAPPSGRVILALTVAGEVDAAVAVFEQVRSQLERVECAPTDRNGRALVVFETRRKTSYLIVVGLRQGSDPGAFALQARAAEAPEGLPGRALSRGGVRATVHGLTDVNDVWSVRLRVGTTYRIAFSSPACTSAALRRPGARAAVPVVQLRCRGFTFFTPGPRAGGRYTLEVVATDAPGRQPYRLRVAEAAPDDVGVGVELRNRSPVRGALSPAGDDVVDLYHFGVARPSETRLHLAHGGRTFTVALLRDSGGVIASGRRALRLQLRPGRYVVAVRGEVGTRGGRYRLSLRLRDVTTTAVSIAGEAATEIAPGASASLSAAVSPAPGGGLVELSIDRFDPLTGWHFYRLLRVSARASAVSWRPPALGRWRIRASFRGTSRSSPSHSGYAHLTVAEPI